MGEELQLMSEIPLDAQSLADLAGYGKLYRQSKELNELGEAKKKVIKGLMNRIDELHK
jgi:hypothetical protein